MAEVVRAAVWMAESVGLPATESPAFRPTLINRATLRPSRSIPAELLATMADQDSWLDRVALLKFQFGRRSRT